MVRSLITMVLESRSRRKRKRSSHTFSFWLPRSLRSMLGAPKASSAGSSSDH